MHTKPFASLTRLLLATLVAATLVNLTGCGPKISGTYTGVPETSIYDKIELKSGGKAVITLGGESHEVTYTVKGLNVLINFGGQTKEFKIDSAGCLNEPMLGVYCKGDVSPPSSGLPAESSSGGGALIGTYEARIPDGSSLSITFESGGKARYVTTEGGKSQSHDATYEVRGDQVTVRAGGETPMQFTRNGNALEQSFAGITVRFNRK